MNTVSVIISHCTSDGSRVYSEISRDTFIDLQLATEYANPKREEGISVLIRPNYNEEDPCGKFFREWRSFNGESFKEVRFPSPI